MAPDLRAQRFKLQLVRGEITVAQIDGEILGQLQPKSTTQLPGKRRVLVIRGVHVIFDLQPRVDVDIGNTGTGGQIRCQVRTGIKIKVGIYQRIQ